MPFRCPKCFVSNTLDIRCSIELPPDRRADEISLQVVACQACRFEALAIYDESRRSVLDSKTWHHTGYQVSREAIQSIDETIRTCPEPHNANCPCPAHTSLGRQDEYGAWHPPVEMNNKGAFPMLIHLGST